MEPIRLLVLFCSALIATVQCQIKPDVCQPVEYNYGYIPPEAPYSYIIKYRQTDLLDGTSFIREIYFDMEKQRYKITEVKDGLASSEIQNYMQGVVISIKESAFISDVPSCQIEELEDQWDISLGYSQLHYGIIKFKQLLNQTKPIRGIPVKTFSGCSYDPQTKTTLNITYAFTVNSQIYSSAFGFEGAFQRTEIGGYYEDTYWSPIANRYDIFWYDTNPYFRDEDFQVPPMAFCTPITRSDKLPASFTSFSVKQETSTQYWMNGKMQQVMGYYNIWRNEQYKITRQDFFTEDCDQGEGKIYSYCNQHVSSVHDFETDLGYVMNLDHRSCQVVPLASLASDPDVTVEGGFVKMADLSFIEQRFTYQMKETYRDIPVKLYSTEATYSKFQNRSAMISEQIYFLDDSWEDYTFDKLKGSMPVRYRKDVVFDNHDLNEMKNLTIASNFYDMDEQAPTLDNFFIRNCLNGLPSLTLAFDMTVSSDTFHKITNEELQAAKDQFYSAIVKAAKIRFVNVDFQQLYKYRTRITAFLRIYDMSTLKGMATPIVKTAKEAITNFKTQMQQGFSFFVTFPGGIRDLVKGVANSTVVQ